MKIRTFISTFYLLCSSLVHADTYIWEDYDDFSGTSLDTNKWEAVYFAGGEEASIENGRVKLSGSAYYYGSPTQVPSELSAAAAGSTEGNAGILLSDSAIFGVEVEITLPQSNNSYEAGVFLDFKDIDPLGSLGHEIRYEPSGTSPLGYRIHWWSASTERHKLVSISVTLPERAGSMPLTNTPRPLEPVLTMASVNVKGAACSTPATCSPLVMTFSYSSKSIPYFCTTKCALVDKILS